MARGRLLSTKRREAYWLAKEEERGRQQAKIEAWKKTPLDMKLFEWLKQHINPLELAATIALTPAIKVAIDEIPNVIEWYKFIQFGLSSPILGTIWGIKEVLGGEPEPTAKIPEWFGWILAFGIAYLVVHNFDAFISAGSKVGGFIASLV